MPLLEARDLVKVYPGGKRAVDGVDLVIEPGEIVGLLGPNGAGKTTTFRMCCGLVAPTEGTVVLRDVDVTQWAMYRRARNGMGYLPQDESIFRRLTVEQNVLAVLEYLKIKRRQRYARTDELLTKFGLQDKRRQVASTLSGGERRRLEIARCLASDPALILLDEPFTGIDPVTIHGIQDIIAGLRDEGISILLTDHRERETLTITDRSYVICAGKVLVCGDAQTVLEDPTAQEMYFGKRFDGRSIIEGKEAFGGDNERVDHERNEGETKPRAPEPSPVESARSDEPIAEGPTAEKPSVAEPIAEKSAAEETSDTEPSTDGTPRRHAA